MELLWRSELVKQKQKPMIVAIVVVVVVVEFCHLQFSASY